MSWIPQQTLQPFSSSTAAIARPRPAAAPVINATLPPGYFFCGSIPLISFFFLLSLPKVSGSSGNFSYSDVASTHYSAVVEWHTCTVLRYLTYVLRNGAHRLSCVCVRGCVSRMAIFFAHYQLLLLLFILLANSAACNSFKAITDVFSHLDPNLRKKAASVKGDVNTRARSSW